MLNIKLSRNNKPRNFYNDQERLVFLINESHRLQRQLQQVETEAVLLEKYWFAADRPLLDEITVSQLISDLTPMEEPNEQS